MTVPAPPRGAARKAAKRSPAAAAGPGREPAPALFAAGLERLAGRMGHPLPGLVAAFSTALPRLPDETLGPLLQEEAARHWRRDAQRVPRPLLLRQTHSPDVLHLERDRDRAPARGEAGSPAGDGMAAGPGLGRASGPAPARLLAVKTADCVPLLALDAAHGRYAALHAGWRGTAGGILLHLLAAWRAAGSDLQSVHLELGPHIQGCCYEVRADCLAAFDAAVLRGAVRAEGGRTWLDLATVLRAQALAAGVPAHQVAVSPHCTYCHRAADGTAPYASYRRASHTGEAFAGTNVGLIGVLGAP
jgi:YfiH family protein